MNVIVHSQYPLSTREKSWVTGIFSESVNPNGSLKSTFGERFHHMFEGNDTTAAEVFLDGPDTGFRWEFQIERF